jgi:hypothetical protein
MAVIAHFRLNMVLEFILHPCLQAIVLAPHRALPHVAACISMGRLAMFSDNKTKVWRQTFSCWLLRVMQMPAARGACMRLSRWWKCCLTMDLQSYHTPSLLHTALCLEGGQIVAGSDMA